MKILITGATGFVGRYLVKKLLKEGHTVSAYSRNKTSALRKLPKEVQIFEWSDVSKDLPPEEAMENVEAVINLMGENLSEKRWSKSQKKEIFNSRVLGTKNLVKGLEKNLKGSLKVFISASAIGHYVVNRNEQLTEESPKGDGFLADLCEEWENSANINKSERTLKVRIGVVLGKEGGILKRLSPIFNLGLGGPIGSGNHMMSWIHIEDLACIFAESLKNENYEGVINGVSPFPVSNKEFSKSLGQALKRPVIFPVPPLALKLVFGEMASIMLDSQSIVSKKLENLDFKFKLPKIDEALQKTAAN